MGWGGSEKQQGAQVIGGGGALPLGSGSFEPLGPSRWAADLGALAFVFLL
jgi:hypothetical protein